MLGVGGTNRNNYLRKDLLIIKLRASINDNVNKSAFFTGSLVFVRLLIEFIRSTLEAFLIVVKLQVLLK